MANTVLIRRSTVNPDPSTLTGAGELSYSYVSGKLFIGNQNGVGFAPTVIGGPGLLADYALINSPTFTGNPKAPTVALSDSSTSIATTAYVKGQNYITQNDNITVTGDVTGSGRNALSLTLSNTGVVAGTYTKLTVDVKGRISSGANLVAADIPTLTANKISDFDTQVRTNRLDQLAIPTANVNLNGYKITNLATPTLDTDAATKAYADAVSQGLTVKDEARVASTTNINIASPGASIDGVTLVTGDRILLKDQTNKAQNGLYSFNTSTTPLVRTTDADTDAEVKTGLFVFITNGTVNRDSGYYLRTVNPIVLGTTQLDFVIFSRAGQIDAGAGLTKTGTTLDIVSANNNRIVVNADSIDLATTAITAGTYRSVTIDAYGRATAGTNPTTLSGYGIVDAQPLDSDLTAVAGLTTNGLIVRSGNGTAVTRTITGVTDRTTIINGDGIAANPTIDIASTYIGQTSITTVGTIISGTWNGTTISVARGGTGSTTYTANHVPYFNGTALVGSNNFTWNQSTTTLTVNGTIDGAIVDCGTF